MSEVDWEPSMHIYKRLKFRKISGLVRIAAIAQKIQRKKIDVSLSIYQYICLTKNIQI